MRYFGRMLDKIRLHALGKLAPEYHRNLGKEMAADGRCLDFLRVKYDDLSARVLAGGSDEEILEWCFETGRRLNEGDLLVWNDFASPTLERGKKEAGISDRADIRTMGDLIDFEEKRNLIGRHSWLPRKTYVACRRRGVT